MKYAILVSMSVFFLCACATREIVPLRQGPVIYKSTGYALCKPQKDISFRDLARIHLGDEALSWKIEDANDSTSSTTPDFIVIPLKEKHRGGIYDDGYQTVPILCYHKFGTNDNSSMSISPGLFRQQMHYLKENGYRVISPEDLLPFLEYRRQIPKKAVLITIDDGFQSAYDVAWPILREFGFPATLFVYTDYVGISEKAITWDGLRELKANGFTIGSHSVAHSDLTKQQEDETGEAFRKRLEKEIFMSKQILDRKLNQDTLIFSFPYGRYNPELVKMSEKAGYRLAVTVDRGGNPFFSNPLALKRDMILKKDMNAFVSRLKTFNTLSLK